MLFVFLFILMMGFKCFAASDEDGQIVKAKRLLSTFKKSHRYQCAAKSFDMTSFSPKDCRKMLMFFGDEVLARDAHKISDDSVHEVLKKALDATIQSFFSKNKKIEDSNECLVHISRYKNTLYIQREHDNLELRVLLPDMTEKAIKNHSLTDIWQRVNQENTSFASAMLVAFFGLNGVCDFYNDQPRIFTPGSRMDFVGNLKSIFSH